MNRNIPVGLVLLFLVLAGVGCAGMEPVEVREKEHGRAAPVASQSFASPQILPGDTWKVYLIASDPDGDMKNIVCTIHQPGVGTYPVSITKIGEANRKELSGYIYLNTLSPDDLNFINLTLTVQIQDSAGHYSQPVQFSLSLNNIYQQEPPPPEVFKEVNLGPILIQLHTIRDEGPSLFERRRSPGRD